ncbi:MAG: Na(+)-translocating NADH-quinone reductase subunit C [Myxococcales bacterium]|nr:Na(+)-translocating NADH-quinone reductase subunit C [Myxococcales bacterium]
MQHSTGFIVMFAAAICVVCSIFVSGSAVLLKDRQLENKILDRQTKVLDVAGLVEEGQSLSRAQVLELFEKNIEAVVVDLESGDVAEGVDAQSFDQARAAKDPAQSKEAPENDAKVRRIPNQALVYQVKQEGKVSMVILPVEGKGLWSTLYGFVAIDADGNTIRGLTFYQHAETPGLGGEVDNPSWKALWPGRKAFDSSWQPVIEVKKGAAGPAAEDPHHVDGLSGATLTSRGVTHLLRFWLGEHGFGPYMAKFRGQHAG